MSDVIKFFVADVFEAFAGGGQFFVNLNGFLGHHFVGLLGAAHQDEVGPSGQALVAIGIEAEPEHDCFASALLLFLGVSHTRRLGPKQRCVNKDGRVGLKTPLAGRDDFHVLPRRPN
jgi:hypothetical protein